MPRRMSSRWSLLDDQAQGQKRTWPSVGHDISWSVMSHGDRCRGRETKDTALRKFHVGVVWCPPCGGQNDPPWCVGMGEA